ncbi:hypothetical protein GVAV_000443 [Gurleya vavrai]
MTKTEIEIQQIASDFLSNQKTIKNVLSQLNPRYNANDFRIFLTLIINDADINTLITISDSIVDIKYLHPEILNIFVKIQEIIVNAEENNAKLQFDGIDYILYKDINNDNKSKIYNEITAVNLFILQTVKKIIKKHELELSSSLFSILVNLSIQFKNLKYEHETLLLANSLVYKSNDVKQTLKFYISFANLFLENQFFCNFLICVHKICLINKKVKLNDNFLKRIGRICIYKQEEIIVNGDIKHAIDFLMACSKREEILDFKFDFKNYNVLEEFYREDKELRRKIEDLKKEILIGEEKSVFDTFCDEILNKKKGSKKF